MKAEIGFVYDDDYKLTDRLRLVVLATSQTETSALRMFARRTGLRIDEVEGSLTIEEPDTASIDAALAQVHGAQVSK